MIDLHPMLTWFLALVAGGGAALGGSVISNALHSGSTATTGGLANPVVSFFEMIGSVVFSIFAVLVPVFAILLLAYPLVAFINGGKYCVVFEMDDYRVKHIQMQKQFEKSQVLSMIVVLAGAKQSLLSNFDQVKSIVVLEKRNVIYLNENLTRNQVYADAADFAFIRDHIISRCKKAKVSYK